MKPYYPLETVSRLREMQIEEFDKVFSITEEAFPIDEYRPYEKQKALLSNPVYRVLVMSDRDGGEIKAFAAVYVFADFLFVEHLATDARYRNLGLGSAVLTELKKLYERRICLEVERPETYIAQRRIGFYKRNGFYLNSYDYVQPPMAEGRKEVSLFIMTTGGAVGKDEFEGIRDTLYREVYRFRNL